MTLACLPMYDLPGLRAATDAWWRGLAGALAAAGVEDPPVALSRDRSIPELLHDPALLLGQTCGYPLTHDLAEVVKLVATPVYGCEGCEGPRYRSAFVVRADEPAESLEALRGRRVAINARTSQSGYNCLRHAVSALAGGAAFFSQVVETGAHGASLAAVRESLADLAATDCVTLALMRRTEPAAFEGLRVLDWSAPAPGLPYVTRADAAPELVERLQAGLAAAAADPALAAAREALCLEGFELLPLEAYRVIDEMEQAARDSGYPDLV